MVKTCVALSPPLEQPRSPEVPLGVWAETLALPAAVINPLVMVTCILVLLKTWVFIVVPLMITTVEDTKLLPFRVSTNPVWTSASVTVEGEIEVKTGFGREEEQNGFSDPQPHVNSRTPQSIATIRDRIANISNRDSSLC